MSSFEKERASLMSPKSSNELDGDDSSDEVFEWKSKGSQRSILPRNARGCVTTRIVFYSLLAILCIVGTLAFLHALSKREDSLSLGEEINGLIPEFPVEAVQFWSDRSLAIDAGIPTADRLEELDRNWNLLMPPGGGLVHIEHDEEYVLPPGMPLKSSNGSLFWILSVYHQLHCLDGIRGALNHFYFGDIASSEDHSHVEHHEHVYHCLEYLRQIILCHGDTALEGSPDGLPGTNGWGTTHICKDQEAIRNFAEEKWMWSQANLLRSGSR